MMRAPYPKVVWEPSLNCRSILLGLCFCFFALQAGSLRAYQLKSQHFEPNRYYIGDRVRMTLEVEVQPNELKLNLSLAGQATRSDFPPESDGNLWNTINISEQDNLPNNLNYRIYKVNIFPANIPNIYTLELSYSVFSTDVSSFPTFSVQGFHIPTLTIPRALSSLTQDGSRAGNLSIADQELPSLEATPLSLPWVDLSIALLIQLIVLLPVLIFQSSRRLRRWIQTIYKNYLQKKPYRQFLRQLHILQQKGSLSTPEYYRILSSQVRHYLSQRTQHPCSAYTTEELSQLKLGSLLELRELWQHVLAVLQASDNFRFRNAAIVAQSQVPQFKSAQELAAPSLGDAQKERELTIIIQFAKILEKQFHKNQQELRHV